MTDLKKVTFAHSPDADDAFMYYGIASKSIDLLGYQIEHELQDIQTLNSLATESKYEVTAVSVGKYPELQEKYQIMSCGASIGRNYGPIVVTKDDYKIEDLPKLRIASPGAHTTSWLLYRLFYQYKDVKHFYFEDVISKVQSGEVDAGILLHEGQLTYPKYGLKKLVDLGQVWFKKTGLPIPLGVDLVRRDLGTATAMDLTKILHSSILYAKSNEDSALDYSLEFGRGVSREEARKFVRMYVSDDTIDMGEEGKAALKTLFELAVEAKIFPKSPNLDILWV